MRNMHIKQFVVFSVTLFMLGKKAVCEEKNMWTFKSAAEFWEKNSCIFPDKSLYKSEFPNVMPRLEQCHLLKNRSRSDSPDDEFKTGLCQAFYTMSINVCGGDISNKAFAQKCLKPETLQTTTPFAEKDVCSYAFESKDIYKYFSSFMQNLKLCQRNCDVNGMKDICELYAVIIYQSMHESTCTTTGKQARPEDDKAKPLEKSEQRENEQISVTTPRTSSQAGNMSTTQLTGQTKVSKKFEEQKRLESVTNNESLKTAITEMKTSTVNEASASSRGEPKVPVPNTDEPKVSVPSTDESKVSLLSKIEPMVPVSSKIEPKVSAPSTDEPKVSVPSKIEPKVPVLSKNEPKAPVPNTDEPKVSELNKDEPKTAPRKDGSKTSPSLLISKITSAATTGSVATETSTLEEDVYITTTENTVSGEEKGADGDSEGDGDGNFEIIPGKNKDQSKDETDIETSKTKTPGDNKAEEIETGKKQSQNTLVTNIESSAGDVYDDSESSPGSGHFLAYFLTAVVICISGYVIYHNKQKILAFIIEGRNNGRGGRQRSKDVKYSQLKSSVEEVMPSLEQTATGKNFVY